MAIPKLPSIGGNVRKNLRGSQFMPYELTGNHTLAVLGYRFIPKSKENQNRSKYQAKVKVLDSTNSAAVGRTYLLNFKTEREGEQQDYADRDRTSFVAAAVGQEAEDIAPPEDNPDDTSAFDAAQQELLDADEKGEFAPEEEGGEYPCQLFMTRTSKTKERTNSPANIKKGEPALINVTFANDYYNKIG